MDFPFSKDFLPLGFGCARLEAGRSQAHSLRLVETAYEAGIRYFDTARLYALGEAEGVLGKALSGRRDSVIITSKVGIMPAANRPADRWKRRALRLAGRLLPALAPKPVEPRFGMFDLPSLEHSVETSLRELHTDYLDALLLHEVDEPDLLGGAVALLERLRREGKIRSYGIASTRDQTQRLLASGIRWPIVQTARTVFDGKPEVPANGSEYFTVIHSVLAGALGQLAERLLADGKFREQWMNLIAIDSADRQAIAGLLLAEALDANQGGIVLFSSASPARINEAARITKEKPYTPKQIAGLRRLVA